MIVVAVDPIGKAAVVEHRSFSNDDENDTLLFEKLQEHILAHYPNPDRIGCPDPATLKKFADTPRDVGLSDLNDLHIFKCAECTRALMELRQKREQAKEQEDLHPPAS
jgi:hypothetical protein